MCVHPGSYTSGDFNSIDDSYVLLEFNRIFDSYVHNKFNSNPGSYLISDLYIGYDSQNGFGETLIHTRRI